MGFCNTTYIVSVQTAVAWGERSVITGANLFMRTIGQALGAALFGFVLSFGIARHVPEAGDAVNQLLQPDARHSLAPAVAARLSDAFAAAMHDNYIILGVFALVVLGFTFSIPARLSPTRQASTRSPAWSPVPPTIEDASAEAERRGGQHVQRPARGGG